MPFLKQIVGSINAELKASTLSDKRFDKGVFLGIAKLLSRNESEASVTIPAIVHDDGKCDDVVIDDSKPFRIYHRVLDLAYTKGDSFGDEQLIAESASMVAIIYGDRRILKIETEQLVAAVQAGFLTQLTDADKTSYGIKTCSIEIGNINLNPQQVYSGEYSGDVDFALRPNSILVSVPYTIVSEYDKQCIDIC